MRLGSVSAEYRFRGYDASSLTRSLRSGRSAAAGVACSHKIGSDLIHRVRGERTTEHVRKEAKRLSRRRFSIGSAPLPDFTKQTLFLCICGNPEAQP